jgi:hypothetical protein
MDTSSHIVAPTQLQNTQRQIRAIQRGAGPALSAIPWQKRKFARRNAQDGSYNRSQTTVKALWRGGKPEVTKDMVMIAGKQFCQHRFFFLLQ